MTVGGIFQLITNDGKQDRMLNATALLNNRLRHIERVRASNPRYKDSTPTLSDIEQTHILFVNAHFKPYAAIGYEYNRVSVNSGNAQLGGEVKFSIPQFGDFFNDMALHVVIDRVEAENASYWTDVQPVIQHKELVRYVNFPGQRLCKRVQFTVNGNPLDEYTSDVYNFHQKFCVQPNKEVGWYKNVGQELPMSGYCGVGTREFVDQPSRGLGLRQKLEFLDGPQTPKPVQEALEMWVPLLFWFNTDPRLSIPSVSIPYGQRYIDIQLATPAELLQSMSGDGSVSPVNLPFNGQVNLSKCELYINNIFVNPEIHDIFIKRVGFTMMRVHRIQTARINKNSDQQLLNQLKWPIECMYIGMRPVENLNTQTLDYPERWNMYSKMEKEDVGLCSSGKSYRFDVVEVAGVSDTSDDRNLVVPGTLFFTASNNKNYTLDIKNTANPALYVNSGYTYDDFSSFVKPTDGTQIDFADYLTNYLAIPVAGNATASAANINLVFAHLGYPTVGGSLSANFLLAAVNFPSYSNVDNCDSYLWRCYSAIGSLGVDAHNIALYHETASSFYNSYIPYTFGGQHVRTPDDCGVHLITFNLYPGSYQPSGHVNVSRAREFYLKFTSGKYVPPQDGVDRTDPKNAVDIVDQSNPADLVVVAKAINFLLISDGSAVLRYST
jgi:hypothetical protein